MCISQRRGMFLHWTSATQTCLIGRDILAMCTRLIMHEIWQALVLEQVLQLLDLQLRGANSESVRTQSRDGIVIRRGSGLSSTACPCTYIVIVLYTIVSTSNQEGGRAGE